MTPKSIYACINYGEAVCPKEIADRAGDIGRVLQQITGIRRCPKTCYQYVKAAVKDKERYYLLLDEIQFMPRFEEMLNGLLRMDHVDIYVTGSNSRFLSSDIVTEFRGRGDKVRFYPFFGNCVPDESKLY